MNEPEYKTLVAGDTRTEGDEWRVLDQGPIKNEYVNGQPNHSRGPSEWRKCHMMLGYVILASDLMHLEFRRPV